jgi:hypothetical protein
MKEFEKWLKGKAGIGWYIGAEEGWKAALKWVLEQENNYESFLADDIHSSIEKELNNE